MSKGQEDRVMYQQQRKQQQTTISQKCGVLLFVALITFMSTGKSAKAAMDPSTNLDGFGFKIFRVESALYPFVQVYMRSFDQRMNPLVNLNYMNIGLMVKGQVYDPNLRQYFIQSVRERSEAIRSILVLDTSKTMAGEPFNGSLRASARFIDAKRPQDQVAIIALDDNLDGYTLVSNFERDPDTLGRRLADLKPDGQKTRLYDGISAALKIAGAAGAGGTTTSDATYVASTSVVVFSDGKDEDSALSRSDLMTRITNIGIPIPVYSLAYSKIEEKYLKNLQALSENSFGKYYHIGQAFNQMTRSVEDIQNIMQSDYVVTFRAYIPVDGERYNVKIGLEYPTGSGKMRYNSAYFEAISMPALDHIMQVQEKLNTALPQLKNAAPYIINRFAPVIKSTPANKNAELIP